ncbi:MAG: DedA family protein [Chloroflexota bacterium]|nr:DedA family protein [Chloroflexota bacterium]
MGEEEELDIPQLVQDFADVVPVEAFPVDALPVHAASWLARLMVFFAHHAYFLTFMGALIENTILLGFLLPGGAVVALAGAGGRTAGHSLPLLILLAASGMCGGAAIDYYLGRAGIARLLHHRWAGRWGRRLAMQLEQAEPLLRRHGWWIMLVAHAFGTGRSSLAVAAGASGLPLKRFMAIEAPAAVLWSAIYAGGGYVLAAQWSTFELVIRRAGWLMSVVAVLVVLVWWLWQRRRPKGGTSPTAGRAPAPYAAVSRPATLASEPATPAEQLR